MDPYHYHLVNNAVHCTLYKILLLCDPMCQYCCVYLYVYMCTAGSIIIYLVMLLFATFVHWRLFVIFLLHLALLIFNLEKCKRTHFKGIFAGYPYIIHCIKCLHEISNDDSGGLRVHVSLVRLTIRDIFLFILIHSKTYALASPI